MLFEGLRPYRIACIRPSFRPYYGPGDRSVNRRTPGSQSIYSTQPMAADKHTGTMAGRSLFWLEWKTRLIRLPAGLNTVQTPLYLRFTSGK